MTINEFLGYKPTEAKPLNDFRFEKNKKYDIVSASTHYKPLIFIGNEEGILCFKTYDGYYQSFDTYYKNRIFTVKEIK